jgi:hypothetical protein
MRDHGGRAGPARPPRPSRRWWRPQLAGLVGAVLALALTVAACSGGGRSNGVASLSGSKQPTATTTAKPWSKQDAMQAALAFARCMRQHGINLPDPQFNGNGISKGRPGTVNPDSPKFKAAEQACQQYEPNGKKSTQSAGGGG